MKTEEEIKKSQEEIQKNANKAINEKWARLFISRETGNLDIYNNWLNNFGKENMTKPPEDFIVNLHDSKEFKLFMQIKLYKAINEIRNWCIFGGILLIISVVASVIYLIVR